MRGQHRYVGQTIRAHLEGICNYFISRTKAWSDGRNQQQS